MWYHNNDTGDCVCMHAHACSVMSDSATPLTVACQAPLFMEFPGRITGVGCQFLLQEIFLTQELNPCLLHWQADSLLLNHLGSPTGYYYICPNPHNVQSQEWTQMWTADFGWWPVNAGSSVVTNVQLVGVVESGGDCTCRGMGRKYVEYLCTFPSISLWT